MCYMTTAHEVLKTLAATAAKADRLRAQAGESLRVAVGRAAEQGLTQKEIAAAIGRSQPEVSRLIRDYRTRRFRPSSRLGRLLAQHRDEVLRLAGEHRARNVRVFGSLVRGSDDDQSDVDLLIDLEPGADLMDLAALDLELERLLGRPVDVVPERMLKPHVARSALDDAVPL